jgi:hypothetical protein
VSKVDLRVLMDRTDRTDNRVPLDLLALRVNRDLRGRWDLRVSRDLVDLVDLLALRVRTV